jgi:hypothetical protein
MRIRHLTWTDFRGAGHPHTLFHRLVGRGRHRIQGPTEAGYLSRTEAGGSELVHAGNHIRFNDSHAESGAHQNRRLLTISRRRLCQ